MPADPRPWIPKASFSLPRDSLCPFVWSLPVQAWEGCQVAEAALVSSRKWEKFPLVVRSSRAGCPPLALFTPDPMGGQATHQSTTGGFPPQKANITYTQK